MQKFNETSLFPKEAFHNDLADEACSDELYARAQDVWDRFNCSTLGDYHDVYLLTDVGLLADVFENFRDMAMQYYGLDPAHYLTLPHFAWDAMLKYTGVELELLSDLEMYNMVEGAKRGGMVQATHRHAKAHNKYLPKDNVDGQPSTSAEKSNYLMYLDANNLYGWAMSCLLPHKEFEWFEGLTEEMVRNYDPNSEYGYYVECDLEYLRELHDAHNDYPLGPTRQCVTANKLNPHCQKLYRHVYELKPTLRRCLMRRWRSCC